MQDGFANFLPRVNLGRGTRGIGGQRLPRRVASEASLQLPRLDLDKMLQRHSSESSFMSSAANWSRSAVQISASGQLVRWEDVRDVWEKFKDLNPDDEGSVPYEKVASLHGTVVFSKKNLARLKSEKVKAKLFSRSRSFMNRAEDGKFIFEDILRIKYPKANGKEIVDMVDMAVSKLSSRMQKWKLEHFSAGERRIARQVLYEVISSSVDKQAISGCLNSQDVSITLNEIQEWALLTHPEKDVRDLLKSMQKEIRDKLYDMVPISEEEFLTWYLRTEYFWQGYVRGTGFMTRLIISTGGATAASPLSRSKRTAIR